MAIQVTQKPGIWGWGGIGRDFIDRVCYRNSRALVQNENAGPLVQKKEVKVLLKAVKYDAFPFLLEFLSLCLSSIS